IGDPAQSMPVPRSMASHAPAVGRQTRKTLGASPPDAGCALSRAYPLRQRVTVMLAVLPDSLRACWAAWRSTALLQSAAVADAVVLVEAAGAVVVVAGVAVEDGRWRCCSHQDPADQAVERVVAGRSAGSWGPTTGLRTPLWRPGRRCGRC